MLTVIESLRSVSAYPVPEYTLGEIASRRDLELQGNATADVLSGRSYRLAKADLLMWLANAPNIAQGGQNYSFSEDQRVQMRNQAQAIYGLYEPEEEQNNQVVYGFKGTRL